LTSWQLTSYSVGQLQCVDCTSLLVDWNFVTVEIILISIILYGGIGLIKSAVTRLMSRDFNPGIPNPGIPDEFSNPISRDWQHPVPQLREWKLSIKCLISHFVNAWCYKWQKNTCNSPLCNFAMWSIVPLYVTYLPFYVSCLNWFAV